MTDQNAATPAAPIVTATTGTARRVIRSSRTGSTVVGTAGAARPPRPRAPARTTIHIRSYLDRMGSQAAVDTGRLVLWWDRPLWLAGHNYRGWQWTAFVSNGTRLIVTRGRAAGTYVVIGHQRLNRQSGPLPRVRADLVLQTCVGRQTGLTLLRRVGS